MSLSPNQRSGTAPESGPLRVLFVGADAGAEACLVKLKEAWLDATVDRIDSPEALVDRLTSTAYDLVLSNYKLAGWTGMEALELVRRHDKHLPFILVTASLGEERAVDCVVRGASDYVLEEHLDRLPTAVRRAVERAKEEHRELRVPDRESRFAEMQRIANLGTWEWDMSTGTETWSDEKYRIFGYAPQETPPTHELFLRAVHPEDRDRVSKALHDALYGRSPYDAEFRIVRPDGSLRFIHSRGIVHRDTRGEPRTMVGTALDVTEHKRAQERLELFRLLIDQASDMIAVVDPDTGRFLDFNERACENLGFSRSELLNKRVFDIDVTLDASQFASGAEELRKTGALVFEGMQERKDGSTFPVEVNIRRVQLDRDYFVAAIRDVTERKRVDQRIHMLSTALQQSPAIVVITDRNGRIEYVNPRAAETTGYAPEELIGQTPRLFKSGQTPAEVYADLWRTITSGKEWRGEFHNRRKNGTSYWVSASIGPITNAAGQITHFIAHEENITKRKKSERALRRSEARYRALVEEAPYGIYRASMDGRFLDVNPALTAMLGYDSDSDLLALDPARDVYQDPGDSRALGERLVEQRQVQRIEVPWKRKDGSRITVALSGRLVSDSTARGISESPTSFEIIVEDVTEHRRLEVELRQAQKMEAVGRLAGGVAHDFNNLLTVISGYVDLLREDLDPHDPMGADLADIRRAADRATALTRQLLAFSRRQVLQPVVLDLNDVIRDFEKMLTRVIGEDVHLLTKLHPALGAVRADPGQIEQVVMNLAINARDAMPDGGKLTLETANLELDENYCRLHVAGEPGRYVMISVSDDGCGMNEETRARIFEPFFTTKERGKGTGLGLSTVYGIVKQSGGFIWVYSEPGRGTTFKIYLPRLEESSSRPETQGAPKEALVAGSETILLVEDEEALRTLAGRILESCGYRVLAASDPTEALLLNEQHRGPIHLMVTDVVMPRMSGPELAERLAPLRPDTRVLYMSGYAESGIVHQGVLNAGASFLQKPFTRSSLTRKVREVLD